MSLKSRGSTGGLRLILLVCAGFAVGFTWLVLGTGSAHGSKAALVKAQGKRTLALIGEQGERNRIHIQMEKGGRHFTLRDTGQVPDYSPVILRYDAGSLPGCLVLSMGDETTRYLRCETARVQRVSADLRDQDDLVQNGDGILRWTELNRDIEAKLGGGADIFNGGPGDDRADGGQGNDILKGWRGNDLLIGGPGEDSIAGDGDYSAKPPRRGGNDVLIGGPTTDYISPGSGRDKVFSGGGNDVIGSISDRDRDIVNCGAGRRDSLLGINYRGIRFREKSITGCETVGSGIFGKVWSCRKHRCVAYRSFRRLPGLR